MDNSDITVIKLRDTGKNIALRTLFTIPWKWDIIYITTDLERIKQMTSTPTTTREYLKTQGISVGKRGRFSAAALGVISKAAQEGVVFTDKKNVK